MGKKNQRKCIFFLKGLELLCIIGQNLYKSDSGSKRACKKAEGLSSWMMDAVESALENLMRRCDVRAF